MITVNKEILMNPDFMNDFASELCEMLEALIDAEFEKGDETDFDFIDECAETINAIRTGDNAQILPLISRKDFLEKLGVKTERRFSLTVAACAAIALILAASAVIKTEENISVLEALNVFTTAFAGVFCVLISSAGKISTGVSYATMTVFSDTLFAGFLTGGALWIADKCQHLYHLEKMIQILSQARIRTCVYASHLL